jgi:hydroxymethylglutaryl-CoA lyase
VSNQTVKIIECPRDAMQGIKQFIPTEQKIAYINQLLKVGYHSIDFGSFVNPEIIPQMADTVKVLEGLDLSSPHRSKLIAIIANERGAREACSHCQLIALVFHFLFLKLFKNAMPIPQFRSCRTCEAHQRINRQ